MVHVRIAPSPTGDPHVGTAYQALFNYVFAKQHKGKFIVRIEDTDQNRLVEGAQQRILDMLEWLGLPPDESPAIGGPNAPYVQSERLERHHAYANQLLHTGKAYRSFETTAELEQMRQDAEQEGQSYRGYDRRYRDLEPQVAQRRADAGELHTIRLKVPLEGHTTVQDMLRGAVTFKNSELDDKVLVKSDGFPTYHLAAMCDDHDMGITHVIRAEEWLVSTPIHIQIYRAFGWEEPQWIHTPWLLGADHKKLSKRTGDVSVESYRARGFLPEALINYLGMMGFSMPDQREIFGVQDLIEHFSWDRVSLGGSIFDIEKLKWLNGKYIREVLSLADLADRIWDFSPPGPEKPAHFDAVVKMMAPRLETLADFLPKTAYFWSEDFAFTEKALQTLEAGKAILGELLPQLEVLETFDLTSTHDLFAAFAAEKGLKLGKIMPPLRAAVAGTLESPDMGSLLEALGKERVLARVRRVLA